MTNLTKQLHTLPTEKHNCQYPDASSGNMNTPREWQRCKQAAGWIWLVLRKWEALASAITYLALCTLSVSLQEGSAFYSAHSCWERVCMSPHMHVVPTTYIKCVGRPNISLLFQVSAERQEKNPEGQRVTSGQEHWPVLRNQHELPESLVRGSLKPIKGFAQGRFK